MTPEEFIRDCTRGCSNELGAVEDRFGKRVISYHEWLTPDQALRAVEIAREEMKQQMMKEAVDGDITFDFYGSDDMTYGCVAHESFCLEERGLKDKDKVKLIIVKEG